MHMFAVLVWEHLLPPQGAMLSISSKTTSAITCFYTCLSSVVWPACTRDFLSIFILDLLPSILPIITSYSIPSLHIRCPQSSSCHLHSALNNWRPTDAAFSMSTLHFFSIHRIFSIIIRSHMNCDLLDTVRCPWSLLILRRLNNPRL